MDRIVVAFSHEEAQRRILRLLELLSRRLLRQRRRDHPHRPEAGRGRGGLRLQIPGHDGQ